MSTDVVGIEPAPQSGAFCQVVLGEEHDRLYAKYGIRSFSLPGAFSVNVPIL
jgi:hypothetical protein